MKAVAWFGKSDVRVEDVPEPQIVNPRDAIIQVTLTAICGSDLHLYDGYNPTMKPGDILGHEFMGEVVEVGSEVRNLKAGDRVVVPFPISCGECYFCQRGQYSLCDNTNPNAWMAEAMLGPMFSEISVDSLEVSDQGIDFSFAGQDVNLQAASQASGTGGQCGA